MEDSLKTQLFIRQSFILTWCYNKIEHDCNYPGCLMQIVLFNDVNIVKNR